MTALTEAAAHPARWSKSVLAAITDVLAKQDPTPVNALDPMCGPGLANLAECAPTVEWSGVEIEPEWSGGDARVHVGSCLHMPWAADTFAALVVSPVYGNRCSDAHDAQDDSDRITYRHKLGRPLSAGSSASLQWGASYRSWHQLAWAESLRVLQSRALVVVNIANHIRAGHEQRVTEWHMNAWLMLGATIEEVVKVETPKSRKGANGQIRTDGERLLVFRGPAKRGML